MSPLLREVEEVGIGSIRRKRNPVDILPEDFFRESDQLREGFASLVGIADPTRVAILPSVSYGVAVAVRNLQVESSQNIILTHEQFPGNVYAWRRLASDAGAEVRTICPPDGPHRGAGWTMRILEAIDSSTAAVSLGQVHWTDGTLFDLRAIGERAREVGAAFIVDGTQSVGALPIDVSSLRPDALICASYKWMLGPYSIGMGYFGPRFDGGTPLEETWIARDGSENFGGLVDYTDRYQPGAARFDVGERSNFILVPMANAGLRQVLDWTPGAIQDYCRDLTRGFTQEAASLGFSVEDEDWRAGHIFGLRMPPRLDAAAVVRVLKERRVHVSLRGSALRISPHVYNDQEDVAALAEALREVAR
jgi:selenocysteine lyase/cysteine desulfurase